MHALILAAALAANPTSVKLNSDGMTDYHAGKFDDALQKFKAAIDADDSNALAHYNYASTLGVFRKQKDVCGHDAYKSSILEHLMKAISLDKGRKKRVQSDADFDSVRDTVEYQTRVLDLSWPKDAAKILPAVTWYGPAPGAYGNTSILHFQPGGKLTAEVQELDADGNPARKPHAGSWKLEGNKLSVDLKLEGASHFEATLTSEPKLNFAQPLGEQSDMPDECDA